MERWRKEHAQQSSFRTLEIFPFRGIDIDRLFGDLRKFLVSRHLLFERLLEELGGVLESEHVGIRADAAIAGNFIMFDPLCGTDQTCIENGWFDIFVEQL